MATRVTNSHCSAEASLLSSDSRTGGRGGIARTKKIRDLQLM